MHFVSPFFDLYSDYLLVNQGQTTAIGLSALVEGKLSTMLSLEASIS